MASVGIPEWLRARAGDAKASGELLSARCSRSKRASTCGRLTLATSHVYSGRRSPLGSHATIHPTDVYLCARWPRMLQAACQGHATSGRTCPSRATTAGPSSKRAATCSSAFDAATRTVEECAAKAQGDALRLPCGRGGSAEHPINHVPSPAGSSGAGALGHGRWTAAKWADPSCL